MGERRRLWRVNFKSALNEKWKISYEKLMKYFKEECDQVKCFAYSGLDENNTRQKKFLE